LARGKQCNAYGSFGENRVAATAPCGRKAEAGQFCAFRVPVFLFLTLSSADAANTLPPRVLTQMVARRPC
jgi:hypothetical protein